MSSNNNNDNSAGTGIAVVVGILAMMAIFVFAFFAFLAFLLTIFCIFAWNKPRTIGKWTLEPHEARGFVLRGIAGMWLLPMFVAFCDVVFSIGVVWDYLPHMMGVGYVAGSVGIEILTADSNAAPAQTEIIPQSQQITYQPGNSQPSVSQQREPEPFKYASWDDEEEFRK